MAAVRQTMDRRDSDGAPKCCHSLSVHSQPVSTRQGGRKGPIRVATDYPLVGQLLTSPAFEVSDRADEASADVLVSLQPIRDFYGLSRSVF